MKPGSVSNSALVNEKAFRLLSYMLVFLMMVCAVMTVGNIIHTLAPSWHSGLIASVLMFVVIDRLYTFRQLKSLTLWTTEWMIAFGAQWILILIVLRFLLSYANGLASFRADLSLITRGYIAELFTPEYVASFLFAFLFWFLCGRFLYVLDEIGLDPALAYQEEYDSVQREAVPAHQRLVILTFSIGIGLVILTALARVDYGVIASNVEGLPRVEFNRLSGGEAGALLYFVFGLALLSLSRLISLQTQWNRLRIPVSSRNLYRQWGIYSVLFLLLVAVVVSSLPAGDSLGLFSVLRSLFDFLVSVLFFIGQLVLSLAAFLITLPFALLGQTPPELLPAAPPPMPVLPPAPPASQQAANPFWPLVRSILLWGSLVAILVVSLIQLVRQHGGVRAALRESRITNWLLLAWQWLYRNVDKTRGRLSRAIADGWENIVSRLEAKRILPSSRGIRLRSLDPRRQVYFFYLAMVRRGGEQGLPRQASQTPAEYAATLENALPAADEDIESITQAFVEARYSRREIDSKQASLVKETWGRIRHALQEKSKRERSEHK